MTEINKLEKELENFHKGVDYLVSSGGKGEKKYSICSESLKKSLRDLIYFGANNEEWQISYGFGQNAVDYLAEADGKFAVYQKTFMEGSPDEFSVLDISRSQHDNSSQVWQRREEFIRSVRNIENSKRIVKESSLKNENELRNQTDGQGDKFVIAYSAGKDKKGNRIVRKKSNSDLSQEGYGYSLANEIVSTLSKSPGNIFFQPEIGRLDITSPEIISAEIIILKDDNQNDNQKKVRGQLKDVKGEDFTQNQLVLPKG